MSISINDKDLGLVTAYAYAVSQGYTGTEEQYAELMASYATVAEQAAASASAAAGSADTASTKATAAANSATAASNSATTATTKAVEAAASATNAANSANTANTKAGEAASSATAASGSASTASTKAGEASSSATAAAGSATAASGSATSANTNALKAEGYAVGKQNGADVASGSPYYENNAKYYSEEAAASAASIDPDTLAKIDGSYSSLTAGNAEQLVSTVGVTDKTPYLFRTTGGSADVGDRVKVSEITGGTVAWNQLVQMSNVPSAANGITYTAGANGNSCIITGTASAIEQRTGWFGVSDGQLVSGHKILITSRVVKGSFTGTFKYGITQAVAVYIGSSSIKNVPSTGQMRLQTIIDKGTAFENDFEFQMNFFDLTAMFGSAIADYLYTLESGTAGAGIAKLKSWGFCTAPYYAYDAGSLLSVNTSAHKTVGFNQWDEEWEAGTINSSGVPAASANTIRSKNFCKVIGGATYYARTSKTDGGNQNIYYLSMVFYDADKNFISKVASNNHTFTAPANAAYFKFHTNTSTVIYGNTYLNDICINLHWDGERDGEYEPYVEYNYPLDSDLELRGIPKLDASNNLYYDGDAYESSGTVERKYGIVDLGTLTWTANNSISMKATLTGIKKAESNTVANIVAQNYEPTIATNVGSGTAVNGIGVSTATETIFISGTSAGTGFLVYELATPTTESADPYQETQVCNDFGTEEFVDSRTVPMPVGANALYQANLRAKLEMAPDSPDGDGDYLVRQTDGLNEYVPLVIPSELPTAPSVNGDYMLKCTVSDDTATRSWSSTDEISDLRDSIASEYTPGIYKIGNYTWYNGSLYRCTTPITTAEAWTAAHWTAAVLGDDVGDLKSDLTAHEEFASEKIGTPEVIITDISGYTLHEGAMSSGGTWNNINSSFKYIVIPVPETGCKIQFAVAQNSERDSVVWCGATQYADAVDGASYYADDVLSRRDQATANYDIPNDVKYILLNTVWGGKVITFSNFSISKAATKGSIEDDVDEINEKIIYNSKNLANPADYVNGYIGASGTIYSPSDNYDVTGYIPISNGVKVAISPKIRQICVFDTSKTSIPEKFVNISDATDPYIFTASNDGYIRIAFYLSDIDSFQAEYGDTVTSYEPYSAPVPIAEKVSELNDDVAELKGIVEKPGIKMLILGDSYSANEVRYIDYLQAHMNITSLVNLGVLSAHLKDIYADRTEHPYDGRPYNGGTGNNNTFGNQIAKLERLMTGTDLDAGETQIYTSASQYPDIILIEGGKNDEVDASTDGYEGEMWEKVNAYSETSGGSPALMDTYLPIAYANTDRTNFAGAMHYLYGALHAKFPNAKMFFITPSGINYSNANHTLYMVKADQMREAARYLCTPTIDWDLEGRLSYVDNRVLGSGTEEDPYTRNASSEYTVDSLHPNWKGGELLGAVVCAKLRMYGFIN